MYKLVLYDANIPATATCHINYFIDDMDRFQEKWFEIEQDADRRERFRKSRAGEYQCDVPNYIETEEVRMLQADDNCRCLYEESIILDNKQVVSYNGFYCDCRFFTDQLIVDYKFILFNGNVYRIAKFKADGICMEGFSKPYSGISLLGNKVICIKNNPTVLRYGTVLPCSSEKREDFSDVCAESIAYKELEVYDISAMIFFDYHQEILQYLDSDLAVLFQDFLGDAG